MEHAIDKVIKKPVLEGQVGENALWEGPLDTLVFQWVKVVAQARTVWRLKNIHAATKEVQLQ